MTSRFRGRLSRSGDVVGCHGRGPRECQPLNRKDHPAPEDGAVHFALERAVYVKEGEKDETGRGPGLGQRGGPSTSRRGRFPLRRWRFLRRSLGRQAVRLRRGRAAAMSRMRPAGPGASRCDRGGGRLVPGPAGAARAKPSAPLRAEVLVSSGLVPSQGHRTPSGTCGGPSSTWTGSHLFLATLASSWFYTRRVCRPDAAFQAHQRC